MTLKWILISLICASFLKAETQSWDTPPEPFELYMYVKKELIGDAQEAKWFYVISQYDPLHPHFYDITLGWEKVTPTSVWEWMNSPFTVIYFPWDWRDAERLNILPEGQSNYNAPSYYPPATLLEKKV